jgi:type III restriction enzyme
MLELKDYQKSALVVLESYLTACRRSGDPEKAFRDSRVAQNVVTAGKAGAIRCVKPAGLENIPYICVRIPTGGGKTILASHTVERIRAAYLETDFPLTFDTLARLAPSGILEMTATPDSKPASGSNVLFATSATELKLENMIKLPIYLTEHEDWKETVDAAIQERRRLEEIARGEERYLRPIILFQAEYKDREVTQNVLRDYLMKVNGIPEDEIAVATGDIRDLDGIDLFSPSCPIRFIITVQALKEGWDCSFAYVFCSVANIGSQKDVEQLLGRVLRLPDARPLARAELNHAYAHVCSHSFSDAAAALKDKMVSKMGFEKIEADLYVDPNASLLINSDPGAMFLTDGIAADYRSMHVVMDSEPDFALLPDETAAKLTIERRDDRVVVSIHGAIDENESRLLTERLATGSRAAGIGTFRVPRRFLPRPRRTLLAHTHRCELQSARGCA